MTFAWFKKRSVGVRAAIIGGMFAAIAAVIVAVVPIAFQRHSESALELVDISFLESEQFPKLDITLRNTGTTVASVKRADFQVEKIWTLEPFELPAYIDVSYSYDVLLPISGAPYSKSIVLHQSIAPDAVDRFTVTLGNDAPFGSEDYVFLMTVKLIYDGDDKCLAGQNLLFATQAEDSPPGDYLALLEFDNKRRILKYKRLMAEFDEMDAVKNKRLESLIRIISEIPIEDEAIRLNPEDADAYYNRGVAHHELGQLEQAIEDFDEAIRLNPEYAGAYYKRGVAH